MRSSVCAFLFSLPFTVIQAEERLNEMQTTNEALWKDFASNDFNSPPLCSHLEGARPRHLALYRPRNQKTLDDTAPSWMSNPPSESVVCYFDTRKADNCSPKCVEAYIEHLGTSLYHMRITLLNLDFRAKVFGAKNTPRQTRSCQPGTGVQ